MSGCKILEFRISEDLYTFDGVIIRVLAECWGRRLYGAFHAAAQISAGGEDILSQECRKHIKEQLVACAMSGKDMGGSGI